MAVMSLAEGDTPSARQAKGIKSNSMAHFDREYGSAENLARRWSLRRCSVAKTNPCIALDPLASSAANSWWSMFTPLSNT